jgi:hypothetical protein
MWLLYESRDIEIELESRIHGAQGIGNVFGRVIEVPSCACRVRCKSDLSLLDDVLKAGSIFEDD